MARLKWTQVLARGPWTLVHLYRAVEGAWRGLPGVPLGELSATAIYQPERNRLSILATDAAEPARTGWRAALLAAFYKCNLTKMVDYGHTAFTWVYYKRKTIPRDTIYNILTPKSFCFFLFLILFWDHSSEPKPTQSTGQPNSLAPRCTSQRFQQPQPKPRQWNHSATWMSPLRKVSTAANPL